MSPEDFARALGLHTIVYRRPEGPSYEFSRGGKVIALIPGRNKADWWLMGFKRGIEFAGFEAEV